MSQTSTWWQGGGVLTVGPTVAAAESPLHSLLLRLVPQRHPLQYSHAPHWALRLESTCHRQLQLVTRHGVAVALLCVLEVWTLSLTRYVCAGRCQSIHNNIKIHLVDNQFRFRLAFPPSCHLQQQQQPQQQTGKEEGPPMLTFTR